MTNEELEAQGNKNVGHSSIVIIPGLQDFFQLLDRPPTDTPPLPAPPPHAPTQAEYNVFVTQSCLC